MERLKELHFTTIIFTDWYVIPWGEFEKMPKGFNRAWFNPCINEVHFREALRAEIRRLQKQRFKVLLYFCPVPRSEVKLQRFIKFAKQATEFYRPDGIGYDMNWHVHKQCLKLQYELFRWLKRRYPDRCVVIDYGFSTPKPTLRRRTN